MKFRTFKICIRKGWYYIICSVSLLLLSAISSTAKASAAPVSSLHTNTSDTIPDKKSHIETDNPKQADTLSVPILMIEEPITKVSTEIVNDSIEDFYSTTVDENLVGVVCMYGPPSVIYKHRPIRRFINWIKYNRSVTHKRDGSICVASHR